MECLQMKQGYQGRGFSPAEKTELWDRWQRGESMRLKARMRRLPRAASRRRYLPPIPPPPGPRGAVTRSCSATASTISSTWRTPSSSMSRRRRDRFALKPRHVAGDVACGAGKMLGRLGRRRIDPHIPVWDKGARDDGTLSRDDFAFDKDGDGSAKHFALPYTHLVPTVDRNTPLGQNGFGCGTRLS